jgi:hypothetical protein
LAALGDAVLAYCSTSIHSWVVDGLAFKLVLYYDGKSSYSDTIPQLTQLLQSLKIRSGAEVEIVPRNEMTAEGEAKLKSTIYLLQLHPQNRGDIVTSRGNMLPLSKGKNLNLGNTPILVIEESGRPIDILPKRVQDHFTSVTAGLLAILEKGTVSDMTSPSAESLAISRVIEDPETLEDGLTIIGNEVVVSTGKIDLLGRDGNQRFVVIEFEREAVDSTIGQVVRLAAGLAEKEQADATTIRKMVVCSRMNEHVKKGAKFLNIEIIIMAPVFSE